MTASAANPRAAAHQVSDFVYQKIMGTRGAFATRIAYVAVDGTPPAQHFQLIVADSDGENSQVILDSRQPIMSPAWSADGQWLAYVSFEDRVASVITLGSPFRGVSLHHSIFRAAQLVRGQILERHGTGVLPACYTAS